MKRSTGPQLPPARQCQSWPACSAEWWSPRWCCLVWDKHRSKILTSVCGTERDFCSWKDEAGLLAHWVCTLPVFPSRLLTPCSRESAEGLEDQAESQSMADGGHSHCLWEENSTIKKEVNHQANRTGAQSAAGSMQQVVTAWTVPKPYLHLHNRNKTEAEFSPTSPS